jgi:outer membrane protein assembly factor BamD
MFRHEFCAVLAALLTLLLAGCPSIWKSTTVKNEASAQELYEAAQKRFEQGDYSRAAHLYDRLKSAYPDFEKMPEVYERIADSNFKNQKYDEAVARYSQFLELFPNHKDADRANYMIGMCFFNQTKDTDLDDSMVHRAELAFKKVIDKSESGQWKKKAEEKYRECRKKLAQKELYKARTYYNLQRYKSARIAAQRILDRYPKLGVDKEAQELIKKTKGR